MKGGNKNWSDLTDQTESDLTFWILNLPLNSERNKN